MKNRKTPLKLIRLKKWEWRTRLYGKEKRRTWRKLHIAVDEKTHDIVMAVVTSAHVLDAKVFPLLLPKDKLCRISQVTGDGAYDSHSCYAATAAIGARPCFPPREGAARRKPVDE